MGGHDVAAQFLGRVEYALGFVYNGGVVQIQAEIAADGGKDDAVGGQNVLNLADFVLGHILRGEFAAGEVFLDAADAQLRPPWRCSGENPV